MNVSLLMWLVPASELYSMCMSLAAGFPRFPKQTMNVIAIEMQVVGVSLADLCCCMWEARFALVAVMFASMVCTGYCDACRRR